MLFFDLAWEVVSAEENVDVVRVEYLVQLLAHCVRLNSIKISSNIFQKVIDFKRFATKIGNFDTYI